MREDSKGMCVVRRQMLFTTLELYPAKFASSSITCFLCHKPTSLRVLERRMALHVNILVEKTTII